MLNMGNKKSSKNSQVGDKTVDSSIESEPDLPEIDLISLSEPPELGDFSVVWDHLASSRIITRPSSPGGSDVTEVPPSRKQLLRTAKNGISTDSTGANAVAIGTSENSVRKARHKSKSKLKKSKERQRHPESSSFEDEEESSWYSSSYEDKTNSFVISPRRKSFLYVPPAFLSPVSSPKVTAIVPASPSAADRRRSLTQKLLAKYPAEVDRILLPKSNQQPQSNYLSSLATLQVSDLHIFIDNSNILIGFYDAYKAKHNITDPFFRHPKFDFHAFTLILERGRPVATKVLVGSNPLVQPVALAQHLGYQVSILERVVDTSQKTAMGNPYASDSATRTPQRERKKEQAVDEILHLKILECLLDVEKPATIVLATGDAAPAEFSPEGGFLKCIQRALTRGWHVELVCWKRSMSRLWREKVFRSEWRNTFTVVELDDFVDELILE